MIGKGPRERQPPLGTQHSPSAAREANVSNVCPSRPADRPTDLRGDKMLASVPWEPVHTDPAAVQRDISLALSPSGRSLAPVANDLAGMRSRDVLFAAISSLRTGRGQTADRLCAVPSCHDNCVAVVFMGWVCCISRTRQRPPGLAATSPPLRVSGSCHLAGSRRWSVWESLRCSALLGQLMTRSRTAVASAARQPLRPGKEFPRQWCVFGAAGDLELGVPSARGERGAKP